MILTQVVVAAECSEWYRQATGGRVVFADLSKEEQEKWKRVAVAGVTMAYKSERFRELKKWKNGEDLGDLMEAMATAAGEMPVSHVDQWPVWEKVAQKLAEKLLYCGNNKDVMLPMLKPVRKGRRAEVYADLLAENGL